MSEFSSREDLLRGLELTPHGSFLLRGDPNKPTFIFIHGFATFIDDLIPLALAFHQEGYTCDLLGLKGHGDNFEALKSSNYSEWYEQVKNTYFFHKEKGQKTFIVGFSLGALLAMDLARDNGVDGIIGISTFLGAHGFQGWLYRLISRLPGYNLTRMLQVTTQRTRKELSFNQRLPLALMGTIQEQARRVRTEVYKINCPTLMLHSIDDKAADYNAVAETYYTMPQGSRLVTFRSLNHFLQFDVPAVRLRDLVLDFLNLKQAPPNEVSSEDALKNVYTQVNEESRQWAGHIFSLIVGFFSIFGALVFFSFDAVASMKPEAPYFAMLYSFIANIYLTLIILYYYYLNRTLAYVKHHIEPSMTFVTWVSYKSYKWISGEESVILTGAVSIFLVLIPVLISAGSIIYCLHYFPARFSTFRPDNLFLQFLVFFSLLMLAFNLGLGLLTMNTSQSELHGGMVRARHTRMSFEKQLMELYSSIKPGIVRQPWAHPEQRSFPSKGMILVLNLLAIAQAALNGLLAEIRRLLRAIRDKSLKS
jgi:carboxylesterase